MPLDIIPDSNPSPAEQVAAILDSDTGLAVRPSPLVALADGIAYIGRASPKLAAAIAEEFLDAARLSPEAANVYRPPSVRALARRAGVPHSTAVRIIAAARARTNSNKVEQT